MPELAESTSVATNEQQPVEGILFDEFLEKVPPNQLRVVDHIALGKMTGAGKSYLIVNFPTTTRTSLAFRGTVLRQVLGLFFVPMARLESMSQKRPMLLKNSSLIAIPLQRGMRNVYPAVRDRS